MPSRLDIRILASKSSLRLTFGRFCVSGNERRKVRELIGIAGLRFHSLRLPCDSQAVEISFDPLKRTQTLVERGLDFADAAEVLQGTQSTFPIAARTTAKTGSQALGCRKVVW